MRVTHIQLLERSFTGEGRCIAKVRLVAAGGQTILLQCNVPGHEDRRLRTLNATIAQDALRQLRHLPEYRSTPMEATEFSMPKPPPRRRVRLPSR